MPDARTILSAKRDGQALSKDDLSWFANGLASGVVSDAQAGAFAMAVLLNGMTEEERVNWTLAMRDSGQVMEWNLPGPVVDKHSTGGIGDAVSLVLAPALAVLGVYVPMVSGRGLGHTGGTLDKLEAIPGLKTEVDEGKFRQIVENVGMAIVSATGEIAPADKRLYAVRDVSGTVESIDLITSSILSKKLAAGLEALISDVKVGSGAFMKTHDAAGALARSLVDTSNGAGCKSRALITDMNAPVASSIGNALEVMSVMEALTLGQTDNRLCQLSGELGGELLVMCGLAESESVAKEQVLDAIRDGSAAERFGRMVTALGGPADFLENWRDRLPAAPVVREVTLGIEGYLSKIDGQELGMCVVYLGGGRQKGGDKLNYSVGLSSVAEIGDRVMADTPVATVHASSVEGAEQAITTLRAAFTITDAPVGPPPLIHGRVS